MSKKNEITKQEDGNYIVKISFDITKQGHYFGVPRNYDLGKVQKLIRAKINQEHIKSGYALCMYGHGARNIKQGYMATEVNHMTNEVQEPVGKILSMSIRDKIITYTAKIVLTAGNKSQSIIDLINGGIGGFSFVWNVEKGFLYGADYVLQPNFNGNRVVMDSICSTGECALGDALDNTVLDAIGDNKELYDKAYNLLSNQDDVYTAIEFRDTMKTKLDSLNEELEETKDKLENAKDKLLIKDEKIGALDKKVKELETKSTSLDSIQVEKTDIEAKYDSIVKSLEDSGIELEDGEAKVSTEVFGGLFQDESVLFDAVDVSTIQSPKIPTVESAYEYMDWNY